MDFESILAKCGDYSKYQVILLFAFGYVNLLTSMHYFAQTIISFTPDFFCSQESSVNLTYTELYNQYFNGSTPSSTDHYKACEPLVEFNNEIDSLFAAYDDFTDPENQTCKTWIYNYEEGYESISTELDWVCDKAHYSTIGQSFFFIGSVLGTICFGHLSDQIGRLPVFLLTSVASSLGDLLTAFTNSLYTFAAARFIAGLSTDTMYYTNYILVFEYLRSSKRTFGLNIITTVFYTFGLVASPWLAIAMGSWRRYLILTALPVLAVFFYPLFLCESAHWLLTKNRITDAIKCLKRVAKTNGQAVNDEAFTEFEKHYTQKLKVNGDKSANGELKKDSFFDMFRSPQQRKIAILLLMTSMIVTLSYDVMGRNMEGLGSSPFQLFSYTSIVYTPAGIAIILLQNTIGRRGMVCSSLVLGSILTAATAFIVVLPDQVNHAVFIAVMIALGRFCSIAAFDAASQHGAELLPTSVRGQGVAYIHVVGYAFNFFSAYIIYLGLHWRPLPLIILSVLMLLGTILCLALPETLNQKLPESIAEGETFGADQKWYQFPCMKTKDKEMEKTHF